MIDHSLNKIHNRNICENILYMIDYMLDSSVLFAAFQSLAQVHFPQARSMEIVNKPTGNKKRD